MSIAAMGATFAFTEAIVANNRQVNDPLNGAVGACAAGFLAGVRGMVQVFVYLISFFDILSSTILAHGPRILCCTWYCYVYIRLCW